MVAQQNCVTPQKRRIWPTLTTPIEDLAATVRVTKFEAKELDKIAPGFKTPYALRNLTLLYKNPDKLRLDGKSPLLGDAVMILNGATRFYMVPKLHVRNTEDLKAMPSRRQSLLEYGGLISNQTLSFMQAKYVGQETEAGLETAVYNLTYRGCTGLSHYRVWIDPKTRITVKRTWYGADNTLRATFTYSEPREVAPGVWVPTQIEVKNAEGVVAAATTIENIRLNQGLADNLFTFGS